MTKKHDPQLKRDILKLLCLTGAILGTLAVFVITPALTYPTLLSLVSTALLTPSVTFFERMGYKKLSSIFIVFFIIGTVVSLTGYWGVQAGITEWSSFKESAPAHFESVVTKLTKLEIELKGRYSVLNNIHPTESVLIWGQNTGKWFVNNGTSLMGALLTWLFIIPPLTFVLLLEGRTLRRRFFQLVPNRFFESFFLITTDITNAITDYISAKLIEALLLGLMVTLGLGIIRAPYAIVLGIIAGITNILPYLGPVLGAAAAFLALAFESSHNQMMLPVAIVYIIANIIDSVVIFPVIVAKLVNLHPLLLIAVVAMGQEYYGLVGMLISIPIATALKVVIQEIYIAVYENTRNSS